MVNFDYQTPTRLIFGKGVVSEKLASVMNQYGNVYSSLMAAAASNAPLPDTTRVFMTW
ncbi:hypothetical protein [Prevotella sp. LMAG:51]|uniref:hypothetical protein n=1 Tax=Prevotella sp. LMAG:51 TaxID=1969564 RepID=UPI00257BB22C|nr:hypothetical protein [Prevotella sp. LMAG:51]